MRKANIVVVGATGAVGQVFLSIMEERRFPVDRLRLCASPRSVGKRLKVNGMEVEVEATTPEIFEGADFAFISVSTNISRQLVPIAARAGALVIDDSSAFRLEPDVPLVVPEINPEDLEHHRGVTAIPNCSTTQMVMALYPLHKASPIKRIIVDTYQAVSGTGTLAMQELREQSRTLLDGGTAKPSVYPHQIAFNVLPHIEPFMEDGYTREEQKMLYETRKIMHAPNIAVSATCVRVPVYMCHSEAVHVEFEHPMSPEEARELLAAFPGVTVIDEPSANRYPLAWQAAGKDDVFVGRIRRDSSNPNGLAMWIVSDNLRKGAALNAIQIAEEVLKRDLLARRRV
ncbi:MAG: aspartate-semialdehyde dehydrogenase [Dehalococcoidia bacterium]|nr:aspartate-semialdehyde dehydrogenase [Dehalococcoidia bacterium]